MKNDIMWRMLFQRTGKTYSTNGLSPQAVFVPAYGISTDGLRLTRLSNLATALGVRAFNDAKARWIILSHAYMDYAATEKALKMRLLGLVNFPDDCIYHIMPATTGLTTSYTELSELTKFINVHGIRTISVVGEYHHLPRVLLGLHFLAPKLQVVPLPFEAKSEAHLAPGRLKGYSNLNLVWFAWNFFFFMLTPWLVNA